MLMKKFLLIIILIPFVTYACEMPKNITSSNIIIIGEQHGKRQQPIYAACILEHLTSKNIPAALALEHIHLDNQKLTHQWFDIFDNADQFAIQLQWWKSGWPSWMTYRPLLTKAYELKIPLIATDSSDILDKEEVQKIWYNDFIPAYEAWEKMIRSYHQDKIEQQKLDELILLQMSRDIHMSRAINAYIKQYPQYLIIYYAGQDHVRNRYSVKQLLNKPTILTIAQNCPKLDHQFDFITKKCEN